jgi:hypothetical protein
VAYQTGPDYKAIAQYFDRETKQPPARLGDISEECFYISEAETQEAASLGVLDACNSSLRELGKFTIWNCQLVVEGNLLTFSETARLLTIYEAQHSQANRRSVSPQVQYPENGPAQQRASTAGSKGKKS